MVNQAAEAPSVEDTIQATEKFFEPAVRSRDDNGYIATKLARDVQPSNDNQRIRLLNEAGKLLLSLHSAVRYDQSSQVESQTYDSSLLLAVYKLLDFLLLEGVYPSLPLGLGLFIEARKKALLYRNHDPTYVPPSGSDQLQFVLGQIIGLIPRDVGNGIEPMLRHRALGDIIIGNAWLAHNAGLPSFQSTFTAYLEKLPIATLFPSMSALLRGSKPEWFKAMISEHLSHLPLRPNGVRSAIEFIAASHPGPPVNPGEEEVQSSKGPLLPLEALHQASRLLSSVPRATSADQYFSKIAPQLLELVDSKDEIALRQAAAFVIGNGILGKRNLGAPGTIGWRLFAEPILQTLNPTNHSNTRKRKVDSSSNVDAPIVSQVSLERSVRRLSALILSHPNSGLTGRLIRPLLLPLWALMNYRGSSFASTECSKAAYSLLERFLNLVGTGQNLVLLADNLLWDGTSDWAFGIGDLGGIAIRERSKDTSQNDDLIMEMAQVDFHANNFCRLLSTSKVSGADLGDLFYHISSRHLMSGTPQSNQLLVEESPFLILAQARVMQTMMEKFSDALTKTPDQVLGLVNQVLEQHISSFEKQEKQQKDLQRPRLSTLSNIAQTPAEGTEFNIESQGTDVLAVALSLLNSTESSAEVMDGEDNLAKLKSILLCLEKLKLVAGEDEALKIQAQTSITLLKSRLRSSSLAPEPMEEEQNTVEDVQQTLNLIISDLTSDLPPIRNSALHALKALIRAPKAPLDVPTMALLVLDLIRNDREEFVYLSAIQTLVQLAICRGLGFVSRLLVSAFQDTQEETSIDGRLRVGEALAAVAEEIASESEAWKSKKGDVVRGVAETVITVAARRGERKREVLERQREERLQKLKKREAERVWGGEVPELPADSDGEYEDLTPLEKQRRVQDFEAISTIVRGWEDTGYEEDVRIRASALSILSSVLEGCAGDLTNTITTNAVDLALSILSLELGPEKAILRRAAVLTIYAILKAADAALTDNKGSISRVNNEDWTKVEKVLSWVRDTDADDLTVGHAEVVLEGVEALRMKMIASISQSTTRGPLGQSTSLEGRLRGLNVDPEAGGKSVGKMKIEELE